MYYNEISECRPQATYEAGCDTGQPVAETNHGNQISDAYRQHQLQHHQNQQPFGTRDSHHNHHHQTASMAYAAQYQQTLNESHHLNHHHHHHHSSGNNNNQLNNLTSSGSVIVQQQEIETHHNNQEPMSSVPSQLGLVEQAPGYNLHAVWAAHHQYQHQHNQYHHHNHHMNHHQQHHHPNSIFRYQNQLHQHQQLIQGEPVAAATTTAAAVADYNHQLHFSHQQQEQEQEQSIELVDSQNPKLELNSAITSHNNIESSSLASNNNDQVNHQNEYLDQDRGHQDSNNQNGASCSSYSSTSSSSSSSSSSSLSLSSTSSSCSSTSMPYVIVEDKQEVVLSNHLDGFKMMDDSSGVNNSNTSMLGDKVAANAGVGRRNVLRNNHKASKGASNNNNNSGPAQRRGQVGRRALASNRALKSSINESAINEAATYKDTDIEHTSTHIIVTDVQSGREVQLTNKELTSYSVRQLNKIVSGFPRQTITKLKQRRRTLKNRGYAQNCRHKRLDQKNRLERQNEQLRQENFHQMQLMTEMREKMRKQTCEINLLRQQIERTVARAS